MVVIQSNSWNSHDENWSSPQGFAGLWNTDQEEEYTRLVDIKIGNIQKWSRWLRHLFLLANAFPYSYHNESDNQSCRSISYGRKVEGPKHSALLKTHKGWRRFLLLWPSQSNTSRTTHLSYSTTFLRKAVKRPAHLPDGNPCQCIKTTRCPTWFTDRRCRH